MYLMKAFLGKRWLELFLLRRSYLNWIPQECWEEFNLKQQSHLNADLTLSYFSALQCLILMGRDSIQIQLYMESITFECLDI